MTSGFMKVHFNVLDKDEDDLRIAGTRGLGFRGLGRPRSLDETTAHFHNDEAAARYYLSKVFAMDERSSVRSLVAPDRAQAVPDARLEGVQEMPLTETRLVRFVQTKEEIPVFGSKLVVELDMNRELVNVAGEVAEIGRVALVPTISLIEATQLVMEISGVDEKAFERIPHPELRFYHDDENDTWHLAYFFRNVPGASEDYLKSALERRSYGHGAELSFRQHHPRMNYLIDAHDGSLLFYYSADPMLLEIPSKCRGVDEFGKAQEFWGRQVTDGFEMSDPLRFIKTYDHQLRDLDTDPLPSEPVLNESYDFGSSNRAAVTAHVNATRVYDFYKSVLMRDGIDDKGMDLISIVNCIYSSGQPTQEWHNAVWYDNKMFYGQSIGGDGRLWSYSRFLDVIAHELTHGVTQFTSDLVYKNQSGALSESFSDIFGVIINNWYKIGPDSDVSNWNWEIGPGLGLNGLPLRDMSDPKRIGDPEHMDDYLYTSNDNGGVHTNSNIHNKAAYNLLTVSDGYGAHVFMPREVAVLYYLCLSRLSSLATFSSVLETLVDVASVYYAGSQEERQRKIGHIRDSYLLVGIQ